jgi:Glycosyltransferases, probably involved in cell wall biogenesis
MPDDPVVTVIVPVCGTAEPLLEACLQSLCAQDFERMEILIIDDNGTLSARKEFQRFLKTFIRNNRKLAHTGDIRCISFGKNRGLTEARRAGFENARGSYCLTVDSDDTLAAEDAVSRLYRAAHTAPENGGTETAAGFDIVQCGCVLTGSDQHILEQRRNAMSAVEYPKPETVVSDGGSLAEFFFGGKNVSLYLWGKLFRTEPVREAMAFVPDMYCIMAEDLLLLYVISRRTRRYTCIPDRLYAYATDTGLTAPTVIFDTARWERMCSESAVFTAIAYDMQERPFPEGSPVPDVLRKTYFEHITRCAFALEHQVVPRIYAEAREAFIEAWGEASAVKAIEAARRMESPSDCGQEETAAL